ncbi:ABC transporter ATP-binding protein [Paludibacter sp. 221]|uniref:ABC transporter ATP-binding protein n=1 Tax=Paludibacter sp. 221 TaxID=2302939 RepID=UPI0013CF6EE9|nr:ABC transporter ATP-binding protein [Paludibacter sp. 221]NDV46026.1 ABC transporter ATP-binding protein [Paludibacter sp. 221]
MSTAIKFENVSKQYRLGLISTRTLSHDLNRFWKTKILQQADPYLKIGEINDRASKGESEYVWALQDINFEVQQGDVIGIIGKNGAGKSTLLKILSKLTAPTTGIIKANGRIASLLEVGTGFHPEMTGRENIYMNGAIMGMTKSEISRKLDEIVDFSGVERYLDTPTKRYSSGMTVRLGFAIAAHLEPEILVVDEVLAVGDAEFQKKAIGKMQDVSRGEGRTVLFVSHNMFSIKNLCDKGVLLKDGQVAYIDNILKVIEQYELENQKNSTFDLKCREDRKGSGELKVTNCCLKTKFNTITDSVICGDEFNLEVEITRFISIRKNIELAVNICNMSGEKIIQLSNCFLGELLEFDNEVSTIRYKIKKLPLTPGRYYIRFYLADKLQVYDWVDYAFFFNVEEGDFFNTGIIENSSVFFVDHEIEVI